MKAVTTGLWSQTYEDRLVELKLPSRASEKRREMDMDMVQTYKLLNSESGEQIFERVNIRRERRATAATDNLLKIRNFHKFRSNLSSTRVIGVWNHKVTTL